jgi:hypothetical protein
MKRVWAFLKKWWWLFVLAAAGLLALLFRGLIVDDDKKLVIPDVPSKLKEKVRQAEEEALVVRVEARVKADVELEKLEEVKKIDDQAERLKRLSALLNDL